MSAVPVQPTHCDHCHRPTDRPSPIYVGDEPELEDRAVEHWCRTCIRERGDAQRAATPAVLAPGELGREG